MPTERLLPADVYLYEDNAGQLYLHRDGDIAVYAGLEGADGATFAGDAAALAIGDCADWTVPAYPITDTPIEHPETRRIAKYDALQDTVILLNMHHGIDHAGAAARRYLGLDRRP